MFGVFNNQVEEWWVYDQPHNILTVFKNKYLTPSKEYYGNEVSLYELPIFKMLPVS